VAARKQRLTRGDVAGGAGAVIRDESEASGRGEGRLLKEPIDPGLDGHGGSLSGSPAT
jgi:hypothetical protein